MRGGTDCGNCTAVCEWKTVGGNHGQSKVVKGLFGKLVAQYLKTGGRRDRAYRTIQKHQSVRAFGQFVFIFGAKLRKAYFVWIAAKFR